MNRIPFVDLKAGLPRDEILAAFAQVVESGQFVGGPVVADFERAFAYFCRAGHAVAVRTGTDALVLALRAHGIGRGDEVITAANSFFASAEAIALVGATPVLADVDDETLLIDPADVARRIGPRTRAIIPVHLFGQMADLAALSRLGLPLIEDACQAHGAEQNGVRAGGSGATTAFSFYPTKNLGAIGEGGAVTTSDAAIAARLRALRDHGQTAKNQHAEVGYNARLDALQCAALVVRLRHLDAAIEARRARAAAYREQLAGVRLVADLPGNRHVYHLLVVRVPDRDAVQRRLAAAGIDSAIHYPTPIHLQPAFAHLGQGPGSCPVAERAAGEILSLPMYPELPLAAVERVAQALR